MDRLESVASHKRWLVIHLPNTTEEESEAFTTEHGAMLCAKRLTGQVEVYELGGDDRHVKRIYSKPR